MWIIDFGVDMNREDAALYDAPFAHVFKYVEPARAQSKTTRDEWWIHERPRVDMREAIASLPRYAGTARVAKHRLFVWIKHPTLPDSAIIAIARDDEYFFGVLQSKIHELWARRTGTQLREAESGFRYTPTTTFETYPFPWPPGKEPAGDPRVEAIARAARDLVEKRDLWLNPEGATEVQLKERSLTNLYNRMPEWLRIANRKLDETVLDAYGWPHDLSDQDVLERMLALNHQRATPRG